MFSPHPVRVLATHARNRDTPNSLSTSRARTNAVLSPHPKTRIHTFLRTISPLITPSNRHFRAPPVPKHPPTSPFVRAPVTAHPFIEACQFPHACINGLPWPGHEPGLVSPDDSRMTRATRRSGGWASERVTTQMCGTGFQPVRNISALHKLAAQSCASVGEHNRPPTAAEAVSMELRVASAPDSQRSGDQPRAQRNLEPANDTVPSHGGVFACARRNTRPVLSLPPRRRIPRQWRAWRPSPEE